LCFNALDLFNKVWSKSYDHRESEGIASRYKAESFLHRRWWFLVGATEGETRIGGGRWTVRWRRGERIAGTFLTAAAAQFGGRSAVHGGGIALFGLRYDGDEIETYINFLFFYFIYIETYITLS
jgi:hypothetical protein